jgi:mannan endo-1,4-beta-mannosidase
MRKIAGGLLVGMLLVVGWFAGEYFGAKEQSQFVQVQGTKLCLKGKPYYFLGTNYWYGCYLGSTLECGNQGRLIRELDTLKALGITNLRILAASEESSLERSLHPAVQSNSGKYNRALLEGLDFLLVEMARRDMHAVLFLNNYWQWSGGMAQYVNWASGAPIIDPDAQHDYPRFMKYSASFYSNSSAQRIFRTFVKMLLNRRNTLTGLRYKDDPTIMAWELANEPRPGHESNWTEMDVDAYCRWIDQTAAYIHKIDRNHLVTTGSEGLAGSLQKPEVFLRAHQSSCIDYTTMHLWLLNWGWLDMQRQEETYPEAAQKALDYFNKHLHYARQLGKPIVLEEFGAPRDQRAFQASTATTIRDRFFDKMFNTVRDSAASGAPIAGSNFWTWGGEGSPVNAEFKWQKGDPFTGDPPQDRQGLNSVFFKDRSTLEILKKHSRLLDSLSK